MAIPDGVLLFQHPKKPHVFAVYANGTRIWVPPCLFKAWGCSYEKDVIKMDPATADAEWDSFMAYDKALRG